MTLEELDEALKKLGLDIQGNQIGLNVRNRVLLRYGNDILAGKKERCQNCWLKEHDKCGPRCPMYSKFDDKPIEAAKEYLSKPNNVRVFPFMCMYVIPVYEEITGQRDTMKELAKIFREQWKKEYGNVDDFPNFGVNIK